MNLNFKPTKIPIYETRDAAGINYPYRVGTTNNLNHYKAIKNKVTFRVKKESCIVLFDNGRKEINSEYFLQIEYCKEILLKEEVKSFKEGFDKANIWADKYLNNSEYLNNCVKEIDIQRHLKTLEEEKVDNMDKAKSIKFPYFSKYSEKNIYEIMQTDLEHCIAYYAGNLSSNNFDFQSLGVSPLNYSSSMERKQSYNCIKYLLDVLHPDISKNLLSYFKDINLEDTKTITLKSGKYEGKNVFDVYEENPGYINWYLQSTSKTIYNIRTIKAMTLLKDHTEQ